MLGIAEQSRTTSRSVSSRTRSIYIERKEGKKHRRKNKERVGLEPVYPILYPVVSLPMKRMLWNCIRAGCDARTLRDLLKSAITLKAYRTKPFIPLAALIPTRPARADTHLRAEMPTSFHVQAANQ